MAAIGVHLGCTCACVAVYKDGRADVIANDAGDRVTPAVVGFQEKEVIVGLAAKQSRVRNAANTIVKVKQILGKRYDDPLAQKHISESKCRVIEKGGKPRYEIDTDDITKLVSPEDVAKLIFSKMKETAQSALGSDVNDAVITVPFDFGEAQKKSLGEAAAAAGFNILRMVHEPSAALLAYGVGQDLPTGKSNVLAYKLGGTSLSVTMIEVNSGIYRVLATKSYEDIGGVYFTEALTQHLASEFQRSYKLDIKGNARAMMKLMNSADVAKHSLSTLESSNCFVDSLYDGIDFDCSVSRARFELICSSLFNQCIDPIRKLLEEVGFKASDVNQVVLCGGSSRIPKLQQLIKDFFPEVELLSSIPPDEVIPIGAAIQAGILLGKDDLSTDLDTLTIECSASDILVKEADESGADKYTVLLPSGTPLPARRQHTLQAPGNISSVCLELFESDGKTPVSEECKFAQIVLKDLIKKDGVHDIVTVLTMKRDGALHVTCTDKDTGKSEMITVDETS
ncbi:heat shock 70 kDa protein 14 [Bombina bombina]|uniref:heat shock 70 kDa protein 14 n=1 Tax=Bombina bombina TaxID=8345 RepID=UPI00235B0000|nr:heat shock 70 kDa protein 14 [Bombina bombina]